MRLPLQHHQREELGVTMTPMIDVVFLLLIFFVCTASFEVVESLLPTQLAAGSSTVQPSVDVDPELEHVVVRGRRQRNATAWVVNERPCASREEVRAVLAAVAEIDVTLPVILDVENDVPLGDMIDVYDLSRLAGFDRIQFAAEQTP
jgi:biopolymer transport protein ExbD